MTILWTGEEIQRYRSNQDSEARRITLQAETIFAEKELKEKEEKLKKENAKELKEEKQKFKDANDLEKKQQDNVQKYISPLTGLEI